MAIGISIDIGPGELIDRITILQLKLEHLGGARRAATATQLAALHESWRALQPTPEVGALADELSTLNRRLWEIEDALREHEARRDFAAGFVELARSVYRANDRRARLKAEIDAALGHAVGDVKVYAAGGTTRQTGAR